MEQRIDLCLEIFVIDILIWLLIKKVLRLKINTKYLFLSQICNIAVLACFIFLNVSKIHFVLIKMGSAILMCLLNANEYNFKNLSSMFACYVMFSLSVFGYYEFLLLIFSSLNLVFVDHIYFNAIFAGAFFVFYLILYFLSSSISNNRNLQSFLAEVSFSLSDKHICLKGLIDSGNSVYDSESKLPVVLISESSLKKFMPLASYNYFSENLASHLEKCILVGGRNLYVPIVKVGNCKIIKNGRVRNLEFVIGVVKQRFYDEKHYDCLLHRDFV